MFTGLIREIGTVRRIAPRKDVLALTIAAPATATGAALGDSIAVQGICLTVTAPAKGTFKGTFTVEAAAETRRLTTVRTWRAGRRVHLEPALRVGEALGGHFVQGHVDGQGRVVALSRAKSATLSKGGWHLTIAYPAGLGRWIVPKGSVAVDGVSLTVDEGPFAAAEPGTFTVNLIPHTMAQTIFATLRPGDAVNLEMDALVKAAVSAQLEPRTSDSASRPLTLQRILAAGFVRAGNRGTP